jgi:hypothetical protein
MPCLALTRGGVGVGRGCAIKDSRKGVGVGENLTTTDWGRRPLPLSGWVGLAAGGREGTYLGYSAPS